MVKIKSYKTSYIKKFYIKNICKFKNRFWRYGYKNNFDWFEKNIKYNDIHNLIFLKKKIIGYSCLREKKINLKKYFIIDTVCVNKKYQNNGFGKKLMIFNNKILKKKLL